MTRRLLAFVLALGLLLAGCGGDGTTTTGAGGAGAGVTGSPTDTLAPGSGSSPSAAASPDAGACPTENTRAFAKTRFAADVGGSVFLFNRYIYQPYQAGTFAKGAEGRRRALLKAGLAAAATVKLLDNASENAKANPTLCRTVAQPLSQLTSRLGGLATGLATGAVTGANLESLGGLLGAVTSGSARAGVPVQEQDVNVPGL